MRVADQSSTNAQTAWTVATNGSGTAISVFLRKLAFQPEPPESLNGKPPPGEEAGLVGRWSYGPPADTGAKLSRVCRRRAA
jgi:hypothetical protein